jgi:hypothetical protein
MRGEKALMSGSSEVSDVGVVLGRRRRSYAERFDNDAFIVAIQFTVSFNGTYSMVCDTHLKSIGLGTDRQIQHSYCYNVKQYTKKVTHNKKLNPDNTGKQ